MFGKRILILVPHPDDEVVACAAAIGRARAEGAEVFALFLTNGCIAKEAMWWWQRRHYDKGVRTRLSEAASVVRFLRLAPAGWRQRPARFLWRELPAVATEIHKAISANAIDQVWVPAYEGGNPDHDALNAVAQGVKSQGLSVLEFAEYNFVDGKPHSHEFPLPNGSEVAIALTDEERRQKRAALSLYKSEKANLGYVGVEQECYRPLAEYDYSQPPHKGTLWYARFQWVPFRHPRVDFTPPTQVSTAITTHQRERS